MQKVGYPNYILIYAYVPMVSVESAVEVDGPGIP
jgi:hypothetical protein